jgi:anti-sigma regulatory factor (Ser/Thr protein kinase)
LPSPLAPYWRWRRVFPGHQGELSQLRRWLSSLLPECPARDDVLSVATELGSNALEHTASGQDGGWFAVEVTWHPSTVQVAVADCGGPAEPKVISDPDGERGRGLLLVRGLSLRTGWTGDVRGRLVWAQIAWADQGLAVPGSSEDPYQATVREGEEALARRFAGVPAWFGRSTLAWWAVAGPAGLVSAPSAQELAQLLHRLLESRSQARSPATEQARNGSSEQLARHVHRQRDAEGRIPGRGQRPGTARTGSDGPRRGLPARNSLVMAPALVAVGAA